MDNINRTTSDVIVVDPRPQDYEKLILGDLQIRFVTSGCEALRSATRFFSGLWLINTRLPDMTGIDLLSLIHERDTNAAIFLVSDFYDHEEEMAARSAGTTAYLCKPPHPTWLGSLHPDVRAGPAIQASRESTYTQPAAYY